MSKEFKKQFEQLSKMSEYIRPDQAWVALNKQKMLRQIQNSTAFEKKETSWMETLEFWIPKNRLMAPLRIAVILFIIVGMTAGSWIAGVSASSSSLPGEVLYRVKIATENTQLALSDTLSASDAKASTKAKLQMQFAARRSKEVKQLVEQNKPESSAHVPATIQKLKETMQDAQGNLQEAKKENSQHVITLAKSITETTSAISEDLKEITKQSNTENVQDVQIVKDVVETGKIVNDTGLQAIEAVLEDKVVSEASNPQEIKDLVQEKVDILVKNIEDSRVTVEQVKQLSAVATSTLEVQITPAIVTSSSAPILSTDIKISTSTATTVDSVSSEEVKKAGDSIKKADQMAGEVKELLSGNQVKEALQKAKTLNNLTTETQQVVVDTKTKVNAAITPTLTTTSTVQINGLAPSTIK